MELVRRAGSEAPYVDEAHPAANIEGESEQVVARRSPLVRETTCAQGSAENADHLRASCLLGDERAKASGEIEEAIHDDECSWTEFRVGGGELCDRVAGIGRADKNQLGDLDPLPPQPAREPGYGVEVTRIAPVLHPLRPRCAGALAVPAVVGAQQRCSQVAGKRADLPAIHGPSQRQHQRMSRNSRIRGNAGIDAQQHLVAEPRTAHGGRKAQTRSSERCRCRAGSSNCDDHAAARMVGAARQLRQWFRS